MTRASGLEELWDSAPPAAAAFDPANLSTRPAIVQAYLAHAIAAGTPLASAVRLRMHGAIRLKRWRKFRAEQVIVRERGMIWRARVRLCAFTIRGEDRFVGGEGAMSWKVLGVLPLLRAAGPDVARSAAGRVAAESIWLPSLLCDDKVWWHGDNGVAQARFAVDGHAAEIAIALNHGCVQSVSLARWGNPDGGAFREASFGARVDQEATFGGYTIPARLRVGWHFDDPQRFDREGKFFEVSIDKADYR
ncbi:MAG TPA: DUF6544 family protein [Casimicrobiaceae bacterium]|nr:DUF6544 family protein [Casimicrobiaceae bacterium]